MIDDFKRTVVGLVKKGHSTSSVASLLNTKEKPVTKNTVVGILNRIPKEIQDNIHQEILSGNKPELYTKHENFPVATRLVRPSKRTPINLEPHTDEIKELYKTTQKPKEIARILNNNHPELNVSDVHIVKHLKNIGIQRTPGEAIKTLSVQKEKEMYDRLKAGESREELAQQYQITPKTMVAKAKKQGIQVPRKKTTPYVWTPDKIKKHDKMVSQGVDNEAIAERLGVTKNSLDHFRKSTGRARKREEYTPDIIDKIKKIRMSKITYTNPITRRKQKTFPGEETIRDRLHFETGIKYSRRRIRQIIQTMKEEKDNSMLNESRIKKIMGMFSRRQTGADRVEHARHAYKIVNQTVEKLKKQLEGAHPDVKQILEYLERHHTSALNMLNKMGAGEDPMKTKKSKEQERM